MHLGLDCRSTCSAVTRKPCRQAARGGVRKQVALQAAPQASLQAAPQAPAVQQLFVAGLDEESALWQQGGTVGDANGHKANGTVVTKQQLSGLQSKPGQGCSPGCGVQVQGDVQPIELRPASDVAPISTTAGSDNGASNAAGGVQEQDSVAPTTCADQGTSSCAATEAGAGAGAGAAAAPAVARKRSWQRSTTKHQRHPAPASSPCQTSPTAADRGSLADVLNKLDNLLQQCSTSKPQEPQQRHPRKQVLGSTTGPAAAQQPPVQSVPQQAAAVKAAGAAMLGAAGVPTQHVAVQPSPPRIASRQLMHHIHGLSDVQGVVQVWSTHGQSLQPQHLTALWLKLSWLLHAPSQQHLLQQSSCSPQGYAAPAGAAVSSNEATAGSAAQHAPAPAPPPPPLSGRQAVQQVQQQHAHLHAAWSSSPVLEVWAGLQQQACLRVHRSSAAQVASQLQAHTRMQLLYEQYARTTRQLRHLQQQQRSRSADVSSSSSSPTVASGPAVPAVGPQGLPATEGPAQSTSFGLESAVPAAAVPAAAGMPGMSKRARSRLVTAQRLHAQFVRQLLQLSTPHLASASPGVLAQQLACLSRLDQQPPREWLDAWWATSLPQLRRCSAAQLESICRAVGHLGLQPPPAWCSALFEATRPLLASATVPSLCVIAHGVARLRVRPPHAWGTALLGACEERFDGLDAPAYALLLHALGRMRLRPAAGWLQEFWDSTASLMDDFTTQELSLLLRGAVYLACTPELSWQAELWPHSMRLLRAAPPEQLANLGWAVVVGLQLRPPRSWLTTWLSAMNRRCGPNSTLGAAAGRSSSSSSARSVLPRGPAHRAVATLAAIGARDLSGWCTRLRVPPPPSARASHAVDRGAAAQGSAAAPTAGQGGEVWTEPEDAAYDSTQPRGDAYEEDVAAAGQQAVRPAVLAAAADGPAFAWPGRSSTAGGQQERRRLFSELMDEAEADAAQDSQPQQEQQQQQGAGRADRQQLPAVPNPSMYTSSRQQQVTV